MKRLTGWIMALAATVCFAAPAGAAAQQTPPQTSTQPAEPQAPTPAQPAPATPQSEPTPAAPASPQVDADAEKRHLTAARDSLSQLTQLPAAAQLTGDARTQVSQLITNFNELITTNVEWRASYGKVAANLAALVGDQRTDESPATPAASPAGAVGTSGTVALDPAIRAKLVEFKSHLIEFEKAAGGSASTASAGTPGSTTAPASASEAAPSASSAAPAATATTGATAETPSPAGTSGTTPAAPPTTDPAPQGRPATGSQNPRSESRQEGHSDALRHIEAIDTLLNDSAKAGATGTAGTASAERAGSLGREQIEEIRTHLTELRRLLSQSGR